MSDRSPSMLRQVWLEKAASTVRKRINNVGGGLKVPDTVRISCGFPKGSHGKGKAIGQCWDFIVSADEHYEIFISPELDQSVQIMGVIAHELIHATAGIKAGHKGAFKKLAEAVGLEGPMTATTESAEFIAFAKGIIANIGEYPSGKMNMLLRKKQTTRLLKCECVDCGYVARVSAKWVENAGTPVCPTDKVLMTCEALDEDEGDDE